MPLVLLFTFIALMVAPPIEVRHLFSVIDAKLIALLRTLTPPQWQLPALAKKWTVKDVACHLLDGNVRAIAMSCGQQLPPPATPITNYTLLVAYLNELNATWVNAMKRLPTALLIDWLHQTGLQYNAIMAKQEMFGPAPFGVAWAGERSSQNWFHVAREYTEKMHHQLQIRHAIGAEADLLTPTLFYPFISTLMYGLPFALRNMEAPFLSNVTVEITGEAGGLWFVQKNLTTWELVHKPQGEMIASVKLHPATAWKLFTKGIKASEVMHQITVDGNLNICHAVLDMVAVMA